MKNLHRNIVNNLLKKWRWERRQARQINIVTLVLLVGVYFWLGAGYWFMALLLFFGVGFGCIIIYSDSINQLEEEWKGWENENLFLGEEIALEEKQEKEEQKAYAKVLERRKQERIQNGS